jgi:hypothetical protein
MGKRVVAEEGVRKIMPAAASEHYIDTILYRIL